MSNLINCVSSAFCVATVYMAAHHSPMLRVWGSTPARTRRPRTSGDAAVLARRVLSHHVARPVARRISSYDWDRMASSAPGTSSRAHISRSLLDLSARWSTARAGSWRASSQTAAGANGTVTLTPATVSVTGDREIRAPASLALIGAGRFDESPKQGCHVVLVQVPVAETLHEPDPLRLTPGAHQRGAEQPERRGAPDAACEHDGRDLGGCERAEGIRLALDLDGDAVLDVQGVIDLGGCGLLGTCGSLLVHGLSLRLGDPVVPGAGDLSQGSIKKRLGTGARVVHHPGEHGLTPDLEPEDLRVLRADDVGPGPVVDHGRVLHVGTDRPPHPESQHGAPLHADRRAQAPGVDRGEHLRPVHDLPCGDAPLIPGSRPEGPIQSCSVHPDPGHCAPPLRPRWCRAVRSGPRSATPAPWGRAA